MDTPQPESTDSFEFDDLSRVVAACDRFESQWRSGGQPRIEAYLEGIPAVLWDKLLRELVAIELELRMEGGDEPAPEEYLARFPDQAAAVIAAFARHQVSLDPNPVDAGSGLESTPPGHAPPSSSTQPGPQISTGSGEATVLGRSPGEARPRSDPAEPIPERFGRYVVTQWLGRGAFGSVYLARDEDLGRLVAIKVPHPGRLRSPEQVESFLAEARMAAGLGHPAIVRVYDVGRYGEGEVFVVFEYVEGRNLSELLRTERLSPVRSATLLAQIAEAVASAHKAGLVHRDLKPSNLLIDGQGRPHIADFGLAIREDLQQVRAGEVAGTPAYMAPEQIRGESHRLDGRTDLWALGVILYLGLLGRLPFPGRNRAEVFDAILHRDPRPPRPGDPELPRELERICRKCLAKRMSDRYETAAELADDLRSWLAAEASTDIDTTSIRTDASNEVIATPHAVRVVPKGLRAFDLEDADFFLKLVPGPRDRDGLPESIRAWKRRIDDTDPARTFAVGLLYGPSGCGKSSFVRAGILPRLGPHVRPIYVEASPEETEARLLAALRRECPLLPADGGLVEAAAALREGEGRVVPRGMKLVLVIDQFEQWLQSHPDEPAAELVRALRHCDGPGLQALLLVRDDFWLTTTRFLRALEVRPIEGVNAAAVELFDLLHARSVLVEFGRALGRLRDEPGPDEARFLDRAVKELAGPDGRVIPVRLALFAEMLRRRPWSSATLRELGGFEGIGLMFLDENFSTPGAPLAHRVHQRAAQAVLEALLPDASSELKGRLRPARMLREAAGYTDRPDDFAHLIAILDHGLRLVTPVDPWAAETQAEAEGSSNLGVDPHYQLAHDYLVPSIRQWLTRQRRETRQGRAELELAAITAWWRDRRELRRLPSLAAWLRILGFTSRSTWTEDQRAMMQAATRHHLARAAAALVIAGALITVAVVVRERERAGAALERALKADYRILPDLLPELAGYRAAHRSRLERLEDDPSAPHHDREVAQILIYRALPTPRRGQVLRARLLAAHPDEVRVIRDALALHPEFAGIVELCELITSDSAEPGARLRAACAIAVLEPAFLAREPATAAALAEALLAEQRRILAQWLDLLGATARLLVRPLGSSCRDPGRDPTTYAAAAETLAEIVGPGPDSGPLARLTVDATPEASRLLLHELVALGASEPALEELRGVLAERVDDPQDQRQIDELARRQAAAAVALAALGEPESLGPLLRHAADPRLRGLLIQRLAASLLPPRIPLDRLLLDRLSLPALDPIERQAVLMTWAETRPSAVAAPVEAAVVSAARALFRDETHPGVHSAAELLLRRWRGAEFLARCQAELAGQATPTAREGPRWELGPNGHTFAILPAPLAFRMGAPPHEKDHYGDPVLHERRIDRSLAVATKEVTVAQFLAFDPRHSQDPRYGGEPGCAAHHLSWFASARYCNWLSQQAGIAQDQWCYPETIESGMELAAAAVERWGYRLPTEAEWEYLCRAGTQTARPFGESAALLSGYAWTWLNSENRAMPPGLLLPNELGIFDALGNVWEWCHDGPDGGHPHVPMPAYPRGTIQNPAADPVKTEIVDANARRETWRMIRGGAYSYAPDRARSAFRDWEPPSDTREYLGLRVVRTLPR